MPFPIWNEKLVVESHMFAFTLSRFCQEFEKELLEQRRRREEEEEPTGWNRVEIDETPVNLEVKSYKQYS